MASKTGVDRQRMAVGFLAMLNIGITAGWTAEKSLPVSMAFTNLSVGITDHLSAARWPG